MNIFKSIPRLLNPQQIIPKDKPPQYQPPPSSTSKAVKLVTWVIGSAVAVFALALLIIQPYRVEGVSMNPTLMEGDRLFILKTGKLFADLTGSDFVPKRGEIIIFINPDGEQNNQFVKRVIGLPNERIVIKDRKITIYNDQHPTGFHPNIEVGLNLAELPMSETHDRIINEGEVFVMGDNRFPNQSVDSRHTLGNIPVSNIEGTVIFRVLPIGKFKIF